MKQMFTKISFIFFVILTLFSCSETLKKKPTKERLKIVATTGHIADLIKNIVKESADVEALMGPGVDPHLYKASLSDLKKLTSADIVFYNGLHLEGKMGEVFYKLGKTKKVIAVSDGIPKDSLLLADVENKIPDPHIWFDILLWKFCLKKATEVLIEARPLEKEILQRNAQIYDDSLTTLNNWVAASLVQVPLKQRVLVTAHDAFGYFGRRYNIEVLGLQGISTLSEYGLNEITTLTTLLVARNIKSVFVETSVSEKAINSVIVGCREKGHNVKIGGSLYSDALGDAASPEGNYIGMFKANTKLIVEGLK